MDILPVCWQGSTRSGEIRSALESVMEAWYRQWAVAPGEVKVCAPDVRDGLREADDGERSLASGASGRLLIELGSTSVARLGAFLAGLDLEDGATGMAAGIGRRALDDLCVQLLGEEAQRSDIEGAEIHAMEAFSERRGGVAARCTVDGRGLIVRLDAAACRALVPASQHRGSELVDRRQAVLASEVSVQAILDLGRLAVADVSMLVPGEVIKTWAPLGAEVKVMAERGQVLASGALVAHQGQRAVQLSTVHMKEGKENGRQHRG